MNPILEQSIADAPPWLESPVPEGYVLSCKGVFRVAESADDSAKQKPDEKLSGPLWVRAHTHDMQNSAWGADLRFIDRDGNMHRRAVPLSRFHEDGNGLAAELALEGLFIVPGRERKLIQYLGAAVPILRAKSVDRLGWIDHADSLAYVTPSHVISRDKIELVYQPERHASSSFTSGSNGLLEDWQTSVVGLCLGQPYLLFAIGVAFAAPLLKAARLDSFGFHVSQRSSRGKTTLAQCAAAVWGNGADPADAPEKSFIRRWNSTANGLEGLCSAHNDGLLVLDELGTCTARDFGAVIYGIFGGQGKAVMDASRNLKRQRAWRICALSTGEITVRERIESEHVTAKAGQLLRLIDLNISKSLIAGPEPGKVADKLKRACATSYGVAGPAFIDKLVAVATDAAELRKTIDTLMAQSVAHLVGNQQLTPEQSRTAKRFALVQTAMLLSMKASILPVTAEEILSSVKVVFDEWLIGASQLQDSDRAITGVREYVLRYQDSRFGSLVCGNSHIKDLAGYLDQSRGLVLFTSAAFREACSGLDYKEAARELRDRKLLYTNETNRLTVKVPVGSVSPRFYAVRLALLTED